MLCNRQTLSKASHGVLHMWNGVQVVLTVDAVHLHFVLIFAFLVCRPVCFWLAIQLSITFATTRYFTKCATEGCCYLLP